MSMLTTLNVGAKSVGSRNSASRRASASPSDEDLEAARACVDDGPDGGIDKDVARGIHTRAHAGGEVQHRVGREIVVVQAR